MSVSVQLPGVEALRRAAEKKSGLSLQTHNAFVELSERLASALHERLSESTLERLWAYSTRETASVSLHTLDVLSRYVGCADWKDFLARLKAESPVESEEFSFSGIKSADLVPGDHLLVGWLPDRQVRLEYKGHLRFEVTESENSSLRPGDSFDCLQFQLGRPLYLDCFRRAGVAGESRYVAGERSGLVTLVRE